MRRRRKPVPLGLRLAHTQRAGYIRGSPQPIHLLEERHVRRPQRRIHLHRIRFGPCLDIRKGHGCRGVLLEGGSIDLQRCCSPPYPADFYNVRDRLDREVVEIDNPGRSRGRRQRDWPQEALPKDPRAFVRGDTNGSELGRGKDHPRKTGFTADEHVPGSLRHSLPRSHPVHQGIVAPGSFGTDVAERIDRRFLRPHGFHDNRQRFAQSSGCPEGKLVHRSPIAL
mmetsp:Transcript_17245/g.35642  ORF Transcript_17245/g.35642 Transcript_17245/m.35642 type:complete len:225 (+) Transcript_17245:233-907(+)